MVEASLDFPSVKQNSKLGRKEACSGLAFYGTVPTSLMLRNHGILI